MNVWRAMTLFSLCIPRTQHSDRQETNLWIEWINKILLHYHRLWRKLELNSKLLWAPSVSCLRLEMEFSAVPATIPSIHHSKILRPNSGAGASSRREQLSGRARLTLESEQLSPEKQSAHSSNWSFLCHLVGLELEQQLGTFLTKTV